MPDSSRCFSTIRGRAMRVTRLDACGNRVLGPTSTAVSDGFVTVTWEPQTVTGEAIVVTNANGKQCVNDTPAPQFTGHAIGAVFCNVNPDLFTMITGMPPYMDADGEQAIGFDMNSDIDLDGSGFALEVWSSVPSAQCSDTGLASYGYFLSPFIKGGVLGGIEIGNSAVSFSLAGALTKDGTPWGSGPYDVELDDAGEAGPMNEPVSATNHLRLFVTEVPPPAVFCGAVPLGVEATGVTAGIPGVLTPANSYAPYDLAGLSGVTASPGTAWTTGQYVLLRDGSKANWNGTAWETGVA